MRKTYMEYSKSNDIAKEELSIKVGQWVLLRNATGILEGLRVHSIGSAALTLSRNHYSLPVASMTFIGLQRAMGRV